MKKLIVLVLLSTTLLFAKAQNYFSNDISYTGQGIVLTTIAVSTDGSFYASGYSKDQVTYLKTPLLIKFDINGEIVWQKSFDLISGGDIQDIKVNHDGACVVVYQSISMLGTMKVSPMGAVIWSKSYDAAGGDPYTKYSLSVAANNQLFVSANLGYFSKAVLFRISDDDGPGDGDGDGNGDEDNDGDNDDDGGDIDTMVIIEDDGSLGKMPSMGMALCDDDTSVIVIGKDNDDLYAFRVGLSGNTLWSKVYDDFMTSNYIRMKSITSIKDGNLLMAGMFSTTYGSSYDKGILSKMDKNGTILWSKNYTASDINITLDFEKVLQTENGNIYIIGSTQMMGSFKHLPIIVQVDENGNILKSMYLSDKIISSVRFPTACIDVASHHNNLIFVSNYIDGTGVDPTTYINKTDDIDHLACSRANIDIRAIPLGTETIPVRPVTGINVTGLSVTTTVETTKLSNLDVNMKSNCKMGSFTEVVIEPNSIQNIYTLEVNVYPNPTTSSLTFELNNAVNASVKIYDLKGNVVVSANLNGTAVDVKGLSSGLYNYVVTSNEGTTKGKFVKQ